MIRFLVAPEQPFDADRDIGVAPHELVRFGLSNSDYWADRALEWLVAGLPVEPVAENLRAYSLDRTHPQRQRHKAARLLKGR